MSHHNYVKTWDLYTTAQNFASNEPSKSGFNILLAKYLRSQAIGKNSLGSMWLQQQSFIPAAG